MALVPAFSNAVRLHNKGFRCVLSAACAVHLYHMLAMSHSLSGSLCIAP